VPDVTALLVTSGLVAATTAATLRAARRPPRRPWLRRGHAGRDERRPPSGYVGRWADLLADLGLTDPVRTLRWIVGAAATALAVVATVSPAIGAAALIGIAGAPRLLLPTVVRRRDDRRDAQLPDLLDRIGAELRGGGTLARALVAAARPAPLPLQREVSILVLETEHGLPAADALHRWAERTSSSDVRLAATALALGARAGGHVARSVDQVAATLRERRQLRAEVRALATQARSSALVLVLAPPAFTLLLSAVEPGAVRFLLTSGPGLACLAAGVALDVIGGAWMARILRSAG
jgi:tight adherence protein B